MEKLAVAGEGAPEQGAGAALTPEERKAKQEAKKKAKAEEKARKEAEKAARAAARGQKATVLTAPDPSDPHGSHYGDAEMVQSKERTDTVWTKVSELDAGKVGQTVRHCSAASTSLPACGAAPGLRRHCH